MNVSRFVRFMFFRSCAPEHSDESWTPPPPYLRKFFANPRPDPMCRVPLLPRRVPVRFQDRIDKCHHRFQFRSFSLRSFAFYRLRASHRLAHHPPVNPHLLGDSSDRSTTMLVLTSDLLV